MPTGPSGTQLGGRHPLAVLGGGEIDHSADPFTLFRGAFEQVLSHNSTGNTTHGETTHTGEKTHRATGDVVGPPTVSSAGDRVDDAAMLGLKNRDNTVGSNAGTGLRDESALPTT